MELSPINIRVQVAGSWTGRWLQYLAYFDLNHPRISVLLALFIFFFFFQCPCFLCSVWQLCLPGAKEDRISPTFCSYWEVVWSLCPSPCFFLTSLPLSLPHIWISLCSAFSFLLLCIVTIFSPSLHFHLTGTLSNPEVLLWILNSSKF